MSTMSSSPNFIPDVTEVLAPHIALFQRFADRLLQSMRVALPAQVQSFNAGPPATVSVIVATDEYVLQNEGGDSRINMQTKALPVPQEGTIDDIPVCFPSAGGWNVTFPIKNGDECLLVFLDTCLDAWWQNGGIGNKPISQRRHNLSDAVAVFGLRSTPRGLANYSTTAMEIRSDDGTVKMSLATGASNPRKIRRMGYSTLSRRDPARNHAGDSGRQRKARRMT